MFYVTGLIQREGRTVINAEQCFKLREKAGGGGQGNGGSGGNGHIYGAVAVLGKMAPRLLVQYAKVEKSGVWPYSSGLLGLMSSRPSSISTTPSCPFQAAHTGAALPTQSF